MRYKIQFSNFIAEKLLWKIGKWKNQHLTSASLRYNAVLTSYNHIVLLHCLF